MSAPNTPGRSPPSTPVRSPPKRKLSDGPYVDKSNQWSPLPDDGKSLFNTYESPQKRALYDVRPAPPGAPMKITPNEEFSKLNAQCNHYLSVYDDCTDDNKKLHKHNCMGMLTMLNDFITKYPNIMFMSRWATTYIGMYTDELKLRHIL